MSRRVTVLEYGPAICGHCDGKGRLEKSTFRRVDIEGEPTLADHLDRVISNHESYAPGRLALSQSDCELADKIIEALHEWGVL